MAWPLAFTCECSDGQVDTYGTQQPIALLKLLLERGGVYDRGKDLNWKNMKDIGYIAAMGKAGGGRNETDPRFVSLFSVFNMTFPDDESLFKIYNSILTGHLTPFPPDVQSLASTITKMTMELYRSESGFCVFRGVLSSSQWGVIDFFTAQLEGIRIFLLLWIGISFFFIWFLFIFLSFFLQSLNCHETQMPLKVSCSVQLFGGVI